MRIAFIGAGQHSRQYHLPAISRYCSLHPHEIELAALCDLQRETAQSAGREYGFQRIYTDAAKMLEGEKLDGCIAITPIEVTASIARQVISAGVPLLMEKPPGLSYEEAEIITSLAKGSSNRVMVSMNRRFDPAIRNIISRQSGRPLEYIKAVMLRHNRRESEFFYRTALHGVDAIRAIAGEIRHYAVSGSRLLNGGRWHTVNFTMASGAVGWLEVFPNCGCQAEQYEIFGPGYRMLARAGTVDSGNFTEWNNGEIIYSEESGEGTDPFVINGTYDETVEFISSLKEKRPPYPSLTDVLPSVKICQDIGEEFSQTATIKNNV